MGRTLQPDGRNAGLTESPPDARLAAYHILKEVEAGAFTDRAAEIRLRDLTTPDRPFAMELAYGCVRLRARLDTELQRLVDRPLDRLDDPILLWLRLGLYQLRELRVPNHAAVHSSVEGARRCAGRRAAGFVNAVLRAAVRREAGEDVFPALAADPVGYLSTYGSHPAWLVRRWLSRWSVEEVERLVRLNNRPPPVTLRLLGEESCQTASRAIEASGARLEPLAEWPRSCRLIDGDPGEVLQQLSAVIQDPAASAVVDYACDGLAGPVLDLCAAPGGKAVTLAWQLPEARPYVAADLSAERLARARSAAARLGLDILFVVTDGCSPGFRGAETLLLDVPCTGTGVLGRRPDARWRANPARLSALVALQRELLDASAELVLPGGRLVYSTCSLEAEENELQVEAFLERHGDFVRESPPMCRCPLPVEMFTARGDLRVLPWMRETDGAFASRLRRRGGDPVEKGCTT